MNGISEIKVIAAQWPAPAGIRALTTTRIGGVSVGPFASMNPATHVGDEVAAVTRNQQLMRQALELPEVPRWMRQVHGSTVVEAQEIDAELAADGVVTTASNVVCAVQTADCLPLFLCDQAGQRIGLMHVGWRGLAAGIVEAGLHALAVEAKEILAWLGPAIGPRAFEVGQDVYNALVTDNTSAAAFRPVSPGKWHADLYALVDQRLRQEGVTACFSDRQLCTYSQPELFFSYRRDGRCGRMASLIWRAEE